MPSNKPSSLNSGTPHKTASWLSRLALLACSLVLLLCCFHGPESVVFANAAPGMHLTGKRPIQWEDFLGVNAHFLWFTPDMYQLQMQMLRALGLRWVRVDLHWDRHEPTENQFRLTEIDALVEAMTNTRLRALVYLVGSAPFASSAPPGTTSYIDQYPPRDPAVFASRMVMLAKRYRNATTPNTTSSVAAWQIWNEPNLPSYWRPLENPADFASLVQVTTDALKATPELSSAPVLPIVMGGMAYYSQMPQRGGALMLEALNSLGALGRGNVIAYHPYTHYPETDILNDNDYLIRANQLNTFLRSSIAAGGATNSAASGIWATEWGWSSYAGPVEYQAIIGEQGQADYTLRRLALMCALDYDRIFLFALSDLDARATVRDRGYGLLDLRGQPKPVYNALKAFFAATGPRLTPIPATDPDTPIITNRPSTMFSLSWRREDGKKVLIFWASAASSSFQMPAVPRAVLYDPMRGTQQTLQRSAGVLVATKATLQVLVY